MSRWFRAHTMQFGLAGLALGVVIRPGSRDPF